MGGDKDQRQTEDYQARTEHVKRVPSAVRELEPDTRQRNKQHQVTEFSGAHQTVSCVSESPDPQTSLRVYPAPVELSRNVC